MANGTKSAPQSIERQSIAAPGGIGVMFGRDWAVNQTNSNGWMRGVYRKTVSKWRGGAR